ncbi:TetR/AcrR family transcriptional regulator [Nocardia crassostreae]|uniref:TetR/AcrR family transcriptional regulator n=1 Tax=Nocardia crassostreae TaxID=53428 RepID=UPI000834F397|nr:TetR/AcrR family transcriptional regulator [Nocardia crassostreae]
MSIARRAGSRSYHHGDLRAELLRSAEATLRSAGVDGLSLRQLARDTGVSHAAPSRHFRDKQALLDALAVAGFERLAGIIEKAAASGSFLERLTGMARAYLRFAIDNPALLAVMFARRHSPSPAMDEVVNRTLAAPIEMIVAGKERGEVAAGNPRNICLTALATLQGLASFAGSGLVSEAEIEGRFDDTITYMLDGLRPRRRVDGDPDYR